MCKKVFRTFSAEMKTQPFQSQLSQQVNHGHLSQVDASISTVLAENAAK